MANDDQVPLRATTYEVRPARADDMAGIAAVDEHLYGIGRSMPLSVARQSIDVGKSLVWVALDANDELVGFCIAQPSLSLHDGQLVAEGWILGVGVHRDAQGNGIAGELVTATVNEARQLQLTAMYLTVKPETGPVPLYERLGFEVLRREADYFGAGQDRFVMRRDLTG